MTRPVSFGLGGLWVLFALCTCTPPPQNPSEAGILPTQKVAQVSKAAPQKLQTIPSFWRAFQQAAASGVATRVVPLTRFPLFQYSGSVLLQDWVGATPVSWQTADSPMQELEPEDLIPLDLTPYGITGLDQTLGFAAEVIAPAEGKTYVLLFGRIDGEYRWVGML